MTDPDPGGPKAYGSGYTTLHKIIKKSKNQMKFDRYRYFS
jgi:hypothetical protein